MDALLSLLTSTDLSTVTQGLALLDALGDDDAGASIRQDLGARIRWRGGRWEVATPLDAAPHRAHVVLAIAHQRGDLRDATRLDLQCDRTLRTLDLSGLPRLRRIDLRAADTLAHLSLSDLPRLRSLDLRGVTSLTHLHLSGLPRLEALHLPHVRFRTALRSVRLLGCRSLRSLTLHHASQVSDLQLSDLPNLRAITLYGCSSVASLDMLNDLPRLQSVNLMWCPADRPALPQLSPLARCTMLLRSERPDWVREGLALLTSLQDPAIEQALVSEITPQTDDPLPWVAAGALLGAPFADHTAVYLARKRGLLDTARRLRLSNALDVTALDGLPALEHLNLHLCRHVSDVSPLARCLRLRTLALGYTSVTDLSPLRHLPHLAPVPRTFTALPPLEPGGI